MAVAEGPSRGGGLLGEGRWVEYRNAALGCCDIEDGNAVGSRRKEEEYGRIACIV